MGQTAGFAAGHGLSDRLLTPRKAFFGYFLWLWKESYPAVGRDRRS